mmetsp:Transcript_28863/g.84610  ORF Transcript_28863/g.84610 Transcript_28863/m.84610 type:complete len:235 (+) Transcript_28863:66-770(+)
MPTPGLEIEGQWKFVATSLTTAELRTMNASQPENLPQALFHRRMQRDAMLRRDLPLFKKVFDGEKAVPVAETRDARIHKLQRLYGIDRPRSPATGSMHAAGASVPGRSAGSSLSINVMDVDHDFEADELVRWTEGLDPLALSASPMPLGPLSPLSPSSQGNHTWQHVGASSRRPVITPPSVQGEPIFAPEPAREPVPLAPAGADDGSEGMTSASGAKESTGLSPRRSSSGSDDG